MVDLRLIRTLKQLQVSHRFSQSQSQHESAIIIIVIYYSIAGAAAQYMNMAAANPYAQYAATAAAATLPQGATTGFPGLSPYQGAVGTSLQEARLQ